MIFNYKRILHENIEVDKQLIGIVADKTYKDIGNCAKPIIKRTQLNKLIRNLSEGDLINVDSFIVIAPDITALLKIIKVVLDKGATIKFHQEEVSLGKNSSMSKDFLYALKCVSHYESQKSREKIAEAVAKSHGLREFKPRTHKLTTAQRNEVRKLYKEKYGVSRLAEKYKVSRRTIYNILNNVYEKKQ